MCLFPEGSKQSCNADMGHYLDIRCCSPCKSELKEKDPCYPLAHRGSSTVGEGHQEHHRGPGTMCLQHCSWGQLLKGKILLQEKERTAVSRDQVSNTPAPNPKPFVFLLPQDTGGAPMDLPHLQVCTKPPHCPHCENSRAFWRQRRAQVATNPERMLSNPLLIRDGWEPARSRWLKRMTR